MKTIAIIYLVILILSKLYEVFTFGKNREPSSPEVWFIGLIINIPVYYILYYVIINY